jgi:predicted dinucleotide-binding enzyme
MLSSEEIFVRIGVIGAGRIGGNIARLLAAAGHDVMLSFSRDPGRLTELAAAIGSRAAVGEVHDAAQFGEVVVLSVPWALIPEALGQAGSLAGRIVIDTTNQFGPGGAQPVPGGLTAAAFNQERMPGARLVKAFNTLTSAFQASAAGRPPTERVVLFLAGDDPAAKATVAGLIEDAGFAPADVGTLAQAGPMEAPRRPGAVYGEEYRPGDARTAIEALHAGRPIPEVPRYNDAGPRR